MISTKLKNEIPINNPKLPPIFEIKSKTSILTISLILVYFKSV